MKCEKVSYLTRAYAKAALKRINKLHISDKKLTDVYLYHQRKHIFSDMNYLGKNIKAIREYWGLTQEELGYLLNATRGMIAQYEKRGSRPKAGISLLIEGLFGISLSELESRIIKPEEYPGLPPSVQIKIQKLKRLKALKNIDTQEEMANYQLPGNSPSGHINRQISLMKEDSSLDTNLISDGYHTFGELYEHRCVLFICMCVYIYRMKYVWRSKIHSDGSSYEGWFIMGINTEPGQQISYHLPMKYWDNTMFAHTLDKAPEFDGHTSADVLERLKSL